MLVLDVDGTLVDAKGNINKRDIEAIHKATESGVTVALSTGRVTLACNRVLKELDLDGYHIFFDGALVVNPHTGDVVHSRPIKKESVLAAVDHCREKNAYLELYSHSAFYADKANWTDEIHRLFFNVSISLEDLARVGQSNDILKMGTIAKHEDEFAQANELMSKFKDVLRFSIARSPAFPGVDFFNILDPEVSKGNALKVLCKYLGIPVEQTLAIGDGLNDISLIQSAGLGVAMGNAFPEVKEVADQVTQSVDQGGVSRAIHNYIL